MKKCSESLGEAPDGSKRSGMPLWLAALALLVGIASALAFPWLAERLVWLVGAAVLLAAGAWFFPAQRGVWLLFVWLVLGMGWGAWAVHDLREGWLSPELEVQTLAFDLRVLGLPEAEAEAHGTAFVAEVVHAPPQVERFPRRLRLHWYEQPPVLKPGEVWRVTARLKRPHGTLNGVGMDYEAWLFRHGVQATGAVASGERVAEPTSWSVDALRWRVRDRLVTMMAGEPSAGLVLGLVLGDRSLMTQAQWEVLLATGTNHLLAISEIGRASCRERV